MKTLTQLGKRNKTKRYLAMPILSLGILGLSACGGSDSGDRDVAGEPGVIDGTGDKLSGTAAIGRPIVDTDVTVRFKDGTKQTAKTNAKGEFDFSKVEGEGPYLLRIKHGEGYLYSIAYDPNINASDNITVNIHPYTDLIIRNWFAEQGIDLDSVFEGSTGKLPEPTNTNAIELQIKAILKNLFPDFNVQGNFGLFNSAFTANSQGFDLLLDKSSVVINQNKITVLVIDNTNNVQTTVIDSIPLNTDLTSATDDIPTKPTNVNASIASATSTLVTWYPSSDDKGISAYNVYRDGINIAKTPYTVYKDVNLAEGESYNYTIEAIDSGDQSSGLTSAVSVTLSTPDNTPPLAPSNAVTTLGSNAVTVSWTQSTPEDVAKYEVLRKEGKAGALTSLGFSIKNAFVDTNVQKGTEYCYSIRSSDAAENVSSLSNESCITVSGSNPVATVNCDNPITVNSDITTNTTWNGCYLVTANIDVKNVATLTIEPGSIIKFQAGKGLSVAQDGILKSIGTESKRITFTGEIESNGYWTGIELNGLSDKNELSYTTVEYGGSSSFSEANVYIGNKAKAKIANSILRYSSSHGLRTESTIGSVVLSSNTISNNDAEPVSIYANSLGILDELSTYQGNSADNIKVSDNNITTDQTWQKLDVPYYFPSSRVDLKSTLTIKPGAKFYFANGGNFDIASAGTLIAKGTDGDRILFSGQQPTSGYWHGLQFSFNNSPNELEYVIVEYAGNGSGNGEAAVNVFGQDGRLKMHNTIIRHSGKYGLDLNQNAVTDLADNTYSQNADGAAIVYFNDIGDLDSGSSYTGNTKDIVTVRDHTVTDDQTVQNIGIAYDFPESSFYDINSKLSVEAGVIMQFGPGTILNVERLGSLTAIGNQGNRITFTGKEKSAGYWGGIQFTSSSSVDNKLDHVIIEYAGGDVGNIAGLVGAFGQDARVDVSNSILQHSSSNGIWYYDSTGGTQTNNTFSDIAGQNVFVDNP